jgi:hypothetical protein
MKSWIEQLDHLAEAFKNLCERRRVWFLIGFTILYLALTCVTASKRMLWNDELFTLYTSRLPTFSDIWSALSTGADQIPPFFHLLTRASFSVLGIFELSVRLPEVVGFWIMSLCLFYFVSKRSSALYGFAAMLFPLATAAYDYAYEARPYGVVLGFSALALLCWQSAAERRRRNLSLVALALSVAGALSSHYFAVLIFFPIAFGELVRSFSRRRVDIPIWVALGTGMSVLLIFLPLIERSKSYSAHFWSPPKWILLPGFYYFLLAPAVLSLVAAFLTAAVPWPAAVEDSNRRIDNSSAVTPIHELAAVFGFIAIPLIGVIFAQVFTGAFVYRYALPAVIGFSILFAFAVNRMANGRSIIGAAFVISLGIGFIFVGLRNFQSLNTISLNQTKTYEFLRAEGDSKLPIVAGDLHTFMLLAYYAPPDISSRLVYLADSQASLRYLDQTVVDQGILDLKPWFRVNAEQYRPYIASQKRFLLYTRVRGDRTWLGCFWGQPWDLNWIIFQLKEDAMRIELLGRNEDDLLFLVSH